MIGASEDVGYVHEPFSPNRGPGICRTQFPFWFTYIRPGTDGAVADDFRRLLAFRYNYRAQALSMRSSADIRDVIRDGGRFFRFRLRGSRPLLKDPIAFFSAEWIAQTFDSQVVVVVRHPAAFASSIKRLGWNHPFSHFLDQPALIEDHLLSFREELTAFAQDEYDILDQAALLWRLVHKTVAHYRSRHADWFFVRHEDLSRDPLGGFRALFNFLDLRYTERVRDVIRRSSSPSNPVDRDPDDPLSGVRDSRANVDNWRQRLTAAEVERVRTQVADVSHLFYGEDEW
jgi:hypothetical protein